MSQHCVLSFFVEFAPAALANHQRYAKTHGYRHVYIDAAASARGTRMQALQRYESLLHVTESSPDNAIVLLLSENAAVCDAHDLDRLMNDRDALLVKVEDDLPQTDVQFWRNTPSARDRIYKIMQRCKLGGEPLTNESMLFAEEPAHPWHIPINGICLVMNTGPNIDPYWNRTPTFTLCFNKDRQCPPEIGNVPRFREMLCEHIDSCRARGLSRFEFYSPIDDVTWQRSTYLPGQSIAFVTLYTPEIALYGRLAERNLRQYCERHGYTLYIFRDIPAEAGMSGTGNWFKPWLLHNHLRHHDWIIWVDADVLVMDQEKRIEDLLVKRTNLLARDIGQWPFNSGVMGFLRNQDNENMLSGLMDRIRDLPDRSTVYSHNGDQYYFIESMKSSGLLIESEILNPLVINTPWFMADQDSFIVHYYGMWPEMRALAMFNDEIRRAQPRY